MIATCGVLSNCPRLPILLPTHFGAALWRFIMIEVLLWSIAFAVFVFVVAFMFVS
jgi:hypothetical protein